MWVLWQHRRGYAKDNRVALEKACRGQDGNIVGLARKMRPTSVGSIHFDTLEDDEHRGAPLLQSLARSGRSHLQQKSSQSSLSIQPREKVIS